MTDADICPHEHTEAVEVRDRTTGGTTTVARICRGCLAQLHPGWSCRRCTWSTFETRTFADEYPTTHHVLERPCQEHA